MWLARDAHTVSFLGGSIGLKVSKVVTVALCPGGSDRGRFGFRVHDSGHVNK